MNISCFSTLLDANDIPVETSPDGTLSLTVEADAGLHQFTVIADAHEFDWNDLYFELNEFGNHGRRTGPWDFNCIDKNQPLVPSYWVSVNGKRVGLWFFQRVSLEDMAAKQFRGRAVIWIQESGPVKLEFTPYRQMNISWRFVQWERDPEDTLDRDIQSRVQRTELPADRWHDAQFWEEQRHRLTTTHRLFEEPLQRSNRWLDHKWGRHVEDIPLLLATHGLGMREDGMERAIQIIDEAIEKPAWGNPIEDGYGHDGDMGAAHHLRSLAFAYRALLPALGEDRAARLREKLRYQTQRFIDLMLLQRDYWGGSVLQDHGRVSAASLGMAVVHLLGVLPEAEHWLSLVVPRVRRSLEAQPRDATIPPSSYCSLFLYLDSTAMYRDAWLAVSDEDIYDLAPFHGIVDYVLQIVRPESHTMIVAAYNMGGGGTAYIGGNAFLNHMAAKYADRRAAYLQAVLLRTPELDFNHPTQESGYYFGALRGFLSYDATVEPLEELPARSPFAYYSDSGLVHYHDTKADLTLSVRCGPWVGYHADRLLPGPCDAMGGSPGAGHFILARGNTGLLTTPDGGYSLNSAICTCLFIDDKGQSGDVGYPMSIPSWKHPGHRIETAHWDEKSRSGRVRMNLAEAYDDEAGILVYVRELLIYPDSIVCRDIVQLKAEHRLSWLFQTKRDVGMESEAPLRFGIGGAGGIKLQALPCGIALNASIQPTPVVYSYASANKGEPFDAARFDATEPTARAVVDFVITWDKP